MKRKITLIFFILLTCRFALIAQSSYVNQVLILNEGHYDYVNQVQLIPVTVGAYHPTTHSYAVFDTIMNARFATHILVNGSDIYVAADNQLIRYDADSHQRLFTATVPGIRKIAVWNNQLLISRGEYLQTFSSYFQAYDKNTLAFLYDLPVASGPQYASEGIVVKNDIAYIAINNGFDWGNEVGKIGRVDLVTHNYLTEIDLGVGGKNPENIILDNDDIYTVNNTDYTTASISKINISSQSVNTVNLMTTTGCGASAFAPGFVLFQVSGDNRLGRFSTGSLSMFDTLSISRSIYGMETDPVNNLIYVGETDYTSYGKIYAYDFTGAAVDSFDVSVSPGNIALDLRSTAGIHESTSLPNQLWCYPNPAQENVTVYSTENKNDIQETYFLRDITGREVKRITSTQSSFTLDLSSFDAGIYILESGMNASARTKIIKH